MEFKMATKKDAEQIYELVQETIRVVYPKYYLKEIVDIPNNIEEDDIADYLSDEYGYCVFSFEILE